MKAIDVEQLTRWHAEDASRLAKQLDEADSPLAQAAADLAAEARRFHRAAHLALIRERQTRRRSRIEYLGLRDSAKEQSK